MVSQSTGNVECVLFLATQVDQVTAEHLQQHFVNFAISDNLGQISTWLLAQADQLGPHSEECQQLAALHSTAVDFPKTGRPAKLDFDLVRKNPSQSI
jgi:RNA-dependent RNA polymerase